MVLLHGNYFVSKEKGLKFAEQAQVEYIMDKIIVRIVRGRPFITFGLTVVLMDFFFCIRFLCYLRLSVIMGVPWIIEILSFSLGTTWLFAASIFNCMQGFVVFITFVWIPKVTKHLKRYYDMIWLLSDVKS